MQEFFNISPRVREEAKKALAACRPAFERIEETAEYNARKVLAAFIRNGVSEANLKGSTGYGYDDFGRDKLDRIFAECLGAEDALVRHNFMSGTHTLTTALFGVLRPGDVMTCVTGTPYDTLQTTLGLKGPARGSFLEYNITYRQKELLPDGTPDLAAVAEAAKESRMIYVQRSRGYSLRPSLTIDRIADIVKAAKTANPQVIVMVDNCYGEFVERREPCDVGVDLVAGSLIKNPGGGIAMTGGYIAGRADLVEDCSYRMSSPGVGREIGCTHDQLRLMYQGFFFAPTVVEAALKTAEFAATLFGGLGFGVTPAPGEYRTDIIQAICLEDDRRLCAFCKGIQKGSPVDSYVTPEPSPMPGYDSKVIMAAGAFTLGASIELSADAPLREPFAVWMQGSLTWPSGKTGVLLAAQSMLEEGLIH